MRFKTYRVILTLLFLVSVSLGLLSCGGGSSNSPNQLAQVPEVRNAIIANLGQQQGFIALMAALARGYGLQQIVDAAFANTLRPSGQVFNADGEVVEEAFPTNAMLNFVSTAPLLTRSSFTRDLQVTIESKFITINDNFLEDIGVDFRGLDKIDLPIILNEQGFSFEQIVDGAEMQTIGFNPVNEILTIFDQPGSLNVLLAALDRQNAVELISQPKVISSDNQEAEIFIGLQPQIVEGNFILGVDQVPKKLGEVDLINDGNQDVEVTIGPAPTGIEVFPNGTILLGGLQKQVLQVDFNGQSNVPIIGEIPIVGRLFNSSGEEVAKRNLMIFVTAQLIDPSGNSR